MKGRIVVVALMLIILLAVHLPQNSVEAGENEKKKPIIKDSDMDGVPDNYDNEENKTSESELNITSKPEIGLLRSSGGGGNWSFYYGSDNTYGAYISDVNWNNTKYIHYANVPWVKINGVHFEIPNDLTFEEDGCNSFTNYYLAYQLYSVNIDGTDHEIEVQWYFYKASINNTGKINVTIQHSTQNHFSYAFFAPVRIDFDIAGSANDCFLVYGGSGGWSAQNSETYQFTYNPVDPTWGMKVKIKDWTTTCWGGVKAWSTSEKNYLLRYHINEYKGDPKNYLNREETFGQDNVIWTTASTSGQSPRYCGPIIIVH